MEIDVERGGAMEIEVEREREKSERKDTAIS